MKYAEIIYNDWGDNLFGFMYIKGEDIENGDDISYLAFVHSAAIIKYKF